MTQPIVYRMESMTNAQRAELKMWVRRLESCKRGIKDLLPKSVEVARAETFIDDAVLQLEAIK